MAISKPNWLLREEEKKRQKEDAAAVSDNAPKKTIRGDVIIDEGTRSTTLFDTTIPEGVLQPGGNIRVVGEEEKQRRAKMTPQERLEEDKQKNYEAGLKTGQFEGLSEEEVTARLKAEGKNVVEGKTEPLPKSDVQKMAEVGAAVPVALANTVSKAVKILTGADMGQITAEQFASTELGRAVGLVTLGGELATAAATAGYAAAYFLPSSTAGLGVVGTAKAATAGAVVKSGIAAKLASGGLVKAIIGVSALGTGASLINGRIQDLSGSVEKLRETMGLISSAVEAGVISRSEAILMFNDIETEINASDRAIQQTGGISLKYRLGKGKETQVNIEKARIQLLIERQKLLGL